MSLDGYIRRADQQPLGSPEQVMTQLTKAFPGARFSLVDTAPVLPPDVAHIASLIFRLFGTPSADSSFSPYWEGSFEEDDFAAVFVLDAGPTVNAVEVALYGRGVTSAVPYFARLFEQTDWQVDYS